MKKMLIHKSKIFKSSLVLLTILLLGVASTAQASILDPILGGLGDVALIVLGWIIQFFVYVIGKLVVMVISLLITVASWQDFIHVPLVIDGWVIIRDLCNMFFILILLVIAFATILHIQNYSIKQLFKRVIIFAILINFSRLICGVIIDFAQVIMLTFVNAFKDIGAGNFTALLGINDLLSIDPDITDKVDNWSIAGSYLLALLYTIVMLVVMLVFLFTLAFRVIMLWIYIILSPLAYLASIVPFGSGVAKNWWQSFTNNVVSGPLLAFFIWLSLASLGSFSDLDSNNAAWYEYTNLNTPRSERNLVPSKPTVGITQAGSAEHMLRFIISISLLIGGLMVTKSLSGGAGLAAAAGFNFVSGKGKPFAYAKKGAKWAGRKAWSGAKTAGRAGLGLASAVDYKATKGLAKMTGQEYTNEQGLLTRATTSLKHNLFTKEGWRKNKRRFIHDPNHSRDRAAASANKYHMDENGRKFEEYYDEKTKKTHYRSKTQNADGTYDYWEKDGKKVEKMGEFGSKFYQNYHAQSATAEKDKARMAEEKARVAKDGEPYKDMSKEELHMLAKGVNDPNSLKGIGQLLAEKGEFMDKALFDRVKEVFKDNQLQMKEFLGKTRVKQAHFATDFNSESEVAALGVAIKKGKVKMSDQNLATLEMDKPADVALMADMAKVFKDNLRPERWLSEVNKIDKEGDVDVASKWAEGVGELSNRTEKARDQLKADRGDLLNGIKLHQEQAALATDVKARQFHEGVAVNMQAEVDQLNSKLAIPDNETINLRANRLILDPNRDVVKSFANRHGDPDEKTMRMFFSQASVKNLGEVDPESLLKSQAAQRAAIDGMTYDKLKGLQKSGNNPGLVRLLAEGMAANNHPEAEKIIYNIANDINVDVEAARQNKVISNLMNEAGANNSTSVDAMNKIRQELIDEVAISGKSIKDYFAPDKDGALKATDNLRREFDRFASAFMK